MSFLVTLPVVFMRKSPSRESEVVSQALFGEIVEILQQEGRWVLIQTPDSYQGWIEEGALLNETSYLKEPSVEVTRPAAHLYDRMGTGYGPILTLPFGVKLPILADSGPRWIEVRLPKGERAYVQRGDVEPVVVKTLNDLVHLSQKFLGLPYTWGGRSSFGYDCSGFVQMLYSRIGIQLPRDACDQMRDSRLTSVSIGDLRGGDLIFFRKLDKGMHVGLMISKGEFIHATVQENMPYIRISKLTDFTWSGHPDAFYPEREGRCLSAKII